MLKYLVIIMCFSMLSDLTGVPLSPLRPIVKKDSIEFKLNSIDGNKFSKIVNFAKSKS